jgi:hypothetical protein
MVAHVEGTLGTQMLELLDIIQYLLYASNSNEDILRLILFKPTIFLMDEMDIRHSLI